MSSFDVIIIGFPALAAAWDRAPRMMERELIASTLEAELLLEREIKLRTPVFKSILRNSISARPPRVIAPGTVQGIVGTAVQHAPYVEFGTRPHWPPIAAIEEWTRVKLGEGPNVAFLIARKISQHGTTGYHMFEESFDKNRAQVERIYRRGVARITNGLTSR